MLSISLKGVYILVFEVNRDMCMNIGSLGYVCFPKGVYGYVGSAKGFGGIKARIKHHMNKYKRRFRWHIDYLTVRNDVTINCVIYAETLDIDEGDVVKEVISDRCWKLSVLGFGSTDSRSPSHLFICNCDYVTCIENLKIVFHKLGLEPQITTFR